eukprot:TRINITY_DN21553_c0_g1_i1.p2 TRINITY_DN21553_c0_g1~~TRINITY_DN21553_c0_g1_i1.p2  ORF type:complete len:292 (+),score=24.85 TRINITY_DN21553_c0_g1_i1:73-948(+)
MLRAPSSSRSRVSVLTGPWRDLDTVDEVPAVLQSDEQDSVCADAPAPPPAPAALPAPQRRIETPRVAVLDASRSGRDRICDAGADSRASSASAGTQAHSDSHRPPRPAASRPVDGVRMQQKDGSSVLFVADTDRRVLEQWVCGAGGVEWAPAASVTMLKCDGGVLFGEHGQRLADVTGVHAPVMLRELRGEADAAGVPHNLNGAVARANHAVHAEGPRKPRRVADAESLWDGGETWLDDTARAARRRSIMVCMRQWDVPRAAVGSSERWAGRSPRRQRAPGAGDAAGWSSK